MRDLRENGRVAAVGEDAVRIAEQAQQREIQLLGRGRATGILAKGAGKDANATIDAELQSATKRSCCIGGPLLSARFVEGSALRRQYAELGRRLDQASRRAAG
jgi:hypothetical protein